MDIEQALEASYPLGRIQVLILVAAGLVYMQLDFIVLSSVFIAEIPPHHCAVAPGYTLNETLPVDKDGNYVSCEEYVNVSVSQETQSCSEGWDYDRKLYGKSITSEWDLVCNKDYLPDLSQSILLAGFVVGAIIAGPAADRYGRKPCTLVATVIINIIGIAVSFSPNYGTFVALRFAMGVVFKAIIIPVATLMYECLLPKHRATIGNIPSLMGTIALMLMAGLAKLVKDWFYFNLVLIIPMVVLMTFAWILPESVRWLISQNKIEKAEETMQYIAKFNRTKDFPSPVFTIKEEMASTNGVERKVVQDADTKNEKTGRLTLLFKPPTLIVTVILGWFMFTHTIVYFGFALTTGSLAGDPYLNFFLSSVVELPARIIPLFILRRTGSLRPLLACFFASGITMVGIIIIESNDGEPKWLLTTLSLLGKFLITFTFPSISLLITELFPTTMRNSGTGVVQLFGSTGSLSSPLLLYMDKFVSNLSLYIMTVTSFVSAFLCLFLPETLNTIQPETTADLKVLFETKRIFTFGKKSRKEPKSSRKVTVAPENKNSIHDDKENGKINEGFDNEKSTNDKF